MAKATKKPTTPRKKKAKFDASPIVGITDISMFAGPRNGSGIHVNHQSSLGIPQFYEGVQLIGDKCGALPCQIYTIKPDGSHELHEDHPAYWLLNDRANEYQSSIDAISMCFSNCAQHGNGYLAIERVGGKPVSLHNLDPSTTVLLYDWVQGSLTPRNIKVRGTVWNGGVIEKDYYDCIHLRGMGGRAQGLIAENPLVLHREFLGLGLANIKWGASYFGSSCRSEGLVLECPAVLNEAQQEQLKKMIDDGHKGASKAGATLLLMGGTKVADMQADNRKSQWIESMDETIRGVAAILGIPPSYLGVKDSESYNSLEQDSIRLLTSLDAKLIRFERECFAKLLTEAEKRSRKFYVQFDRTKFVRNDVETDNEQWIKLCQAGLRLPNEYRVANALPALPDGDRRLQNTTYSFADMPQYDKEAAEQQIEDKQKVEETKAAQPPVPPDEGQEKPTAEETNKKLKASIAKRFCTRLSKKLVSKGDSYSEYIRTSLYNEHFAVLRETIAPMVAEPVSVATALFDDLQQELLATTSDQLATVLERFENTLGGLEYGQQD